MEYKRRTRAGKKIEPLKNEKDYGERTHKKKSEAAMNVDRIYFVNEKYEKLLVTGSNVSEGGEPTRYQGILGRIPETGEYVTTEDHKTRFIVLRVENILNNSKNVPPKKFIILRGEK